MESLQAVTDPGEIFSQVLRSLEIDRSKKAEDPILEAIRTRYGLSAHRDAWVDELLRSGVDPGDFLEFVLHDTLEPFVEMVVDLYAFLYEYASTAGGRTEHFQLDSDALDRPWTFDVSRMPRRIEWIAAWTDLRIDEVQIDWEALHKLLIIDNGIFYGTIDKKRVVQSLIIGRRDGTLPDHVRTIGDKVYQVFRSAVRAWWTARLAQDDTPETPILRAYVPGIAEAQRLTSEKWPRYVGIDPGVLFGPPGYAFDDVFIVPDAARDATETSDTNHPAWPVRAAAFFCALWGLDDASFERAARLLTAHESREDLLRGAVLEIEGEASARRLHDEAQRAIRPTGDFTTRRARTSLRREILLLPFWKRRWFLFELWTLIQVLRTGRDAGAEIALQGVSPIRERDITGSIWSLPTQKAKTPVATLSAAGVEIQAWFQREKKRRDADANMEPDIWLTVGDDDVAIVECKDRIKFTGKKLRDVIQTYVSGAEAEQVWLVNYEPRSGSQLLMEPGEPLTGVSWLFRPQRIPREFRDSLKALIRKRLGLKDRAPEIEHVIIDVSASMNGKTLPAGSKVREFLESHRDRLHVWNDAVRPFDAARIDASLCVRGSGAESQDALAEFVSKLAPEAKITIITDEGGHEAASAGAAALITADKATIVVI